MEWSFNGESLFFLLVQQHTQQLGDILQERFSQESEVEGKGESHQRWDHRVATAAVTLEGQGLAIQWRRKEKVRCSEEELLEFRIRFRFISQVWVNIQGIWHQFTSLSVYLHRNRDTLQLETRTRTKKCNGKWSQLYITVACGVVEPCCTMADTLQLCHNSSFCFSRENPVLW